MFSILFLLLLAGLFVFKQSQDPKQSPRTIVISLLKFLGYLLLIFFLLSVIVIGVLLVLCGGASTYF